MFKKLRNEYWRKKSKKYADEANKCLELSREYLADGDNLNGMYYEARHSKFMYKEAVIIDKMIRAL